MRFSLCARIAILDNSPFINRATLLAKGLTESASGYHRGNAGWSDGPCLSGESVHGQRQHPRQPGSDSEQIADMGFNLLKFLGFTDIEINKARMICGTMTLEGALRTCESYSRGIRLRQSLWNERGSLHPPLRAHPDDGGCTMLHFRCNFQDHQSPERCGPRDHWRCLHDELEARTESQRAYRDGCKASQPLSAKATRRCRRGLGRYCGADCCSCGDASAAFPPSNAKEATWIYTGSAGCGPQDLSPNRRSEDGKPG